MKRRQFFSRLAKAAVAFSVSPGVFRVFPSAKNVEAVVVTPTLEAQRAFVHAFFFQTPIDPDHFAGTWENIGTITLTKRQVAIDANYSAFKARLDAARLTDGGW